MYISRGNMSELLVPSVSENKLNELNKKIIEIKKKIQLSEGQRKANFEEHDAKKRENARRISDLKKTVREMYARYAKAKNNEEVTGRAALSASRGDSTVCTKKCNLEETVVVASEDNMRLRKKLDLIKYERKKHEQTLNVLQTENRELTRKRRHCAFKKKMENPVKKRIERLEVQLEHIRMMQIKANIARMKYRTVYSELKEKSILYTSSLKDLEDDIKRQESEIKRLQDVKEEAIELRDNTQQTLAKEEMEEKNSSKKRDTVIKEYRQRVAERKLELERLERMIFYTRPRVDFETRGKSRVQAQEDAVKDELAQLEDVFVKLRNATGVSRSEDVLARFLSQQATKGSLQKMREATEQEKMVLEKKRQELSAEIETRKFSETRNTEQNAEAIVKLKSQIDEQRSREERAEAASRRVRELLVEINNTLRKLYEKFQVQDLQHGADTPLLEDIKMDDTLVIIELLSDRVKYLLDVSNLSDNYLETTDEASLDKLEVTSTVTSPEDRAMATNDNKSLFLHFPFYMTPAIAPSEDEEEVPSRNTLKRHAQMLVDTKSRRKTFAFKK